MSEADGGNNEEEKKEPEPAVEDFIDALVTEATEEIAVKENQEPKTFE